MGTSASATDLRALFEPRSVALIGASADPGSIAARLLRLLQQHGYGGRLHPVNPRYEVLQGLRVFATIADVPPPVELAVVVVPAVAVAGVLGECAAAGVPAAVVITSGFAEAGGDGQHLQREIAEVIARTGGQLRVCGPNSEGFYNPAQRLCATFSPAIDPEHGYEAGAAGPLAVVSQSGGLAFALLNHARERGLAVGPVVSTGNEVDLGWADYADYLLDQPSIRVVLGFVEGFRHPERLVGVAAKAARLGKPMIVAKIGRSEAGRRAAASHTASLVGADAAHTAMFRQLGIMRVDDVDEMLDLAVYFSVGRLPRGRRVAILTASGGAGGWLADACAARGLELPPPAPADQAIIRSFIPAYASVGNPVDITAQAVLEGGFERALAVLASSDAFDTLVPIGTLVREERFFETLPEFKAAIGDRAAVAYFSYTRASPAAVAALAEIGVPCFSTPVRTAQALRAAVEYAEFRQRLDQVAVMQPRAAVAAWPTPGHRLSEEGARAYLGPLKIPSPESRLAQTADQAAAAFEALGGQPVALKIQSPDVIHKTDAGGVRLDLRTSDAVRQAFAEISASARAAHPTAHTEGTLVQRMAPAGVDAFVAARREPLVGPLVVVGVGGVDVEARGDVAMRLAPVSLAEAHGMLAELRGAASFRGTRGRPAADVEALAATVVCMSEMAADLPPAVTTVEINPLRVLAVGQGVLMLDAAIELEGNASS